MTNSDRRRRLRLLAVILFMPLLAFVQETPALTQGLSQDDETFFASSVEVSTLPNPVPLPQDIRGVVLNRDGRGMSGVGVKVRAEGDWEATTVTGAGGGFYFTLTEGRFSVTIIDRVSRPAFFRVDGKTTIRITFQETVARPVPTATATPPSTLVPTTPEASPTANPTEAPGATPARRTPTPTVTPLTNEPITGNRASGGGDSWVGTFLAGIGLGIAVFLVVFVAMRRRQQ